MPNYGSFLEAVAVMLNSWGGVSYRLVGMSPRNRSRVS